MSRADPWQPPEDSSPSAGLVGDGSSISNVYVGGSSTPLTTPTSGYATASLILGLATFVSFGFSGVLAIIFGHLAVRETKTGQRAGHGMAITGLILGYLPVAGWLLFAAILIIGSLAAGTGASQ